MLKKAVWDFGWKLNDLAAQAENIKIDWQDEAVDFEKCYTLLEDVEKARSVFKGILTAMEGKE